MRDRQRIASAATLVLAAYLGSRLLGWLREVVIASQFGTTRTYDAYLLAFIIPDLLVSLVVAGALSSAFIPVLSGYIASGREDEANHISLALLNLGSLVLVAGAMVLFVLTPLFVPLIAPGFSAPDRELTARLTRIMLVQPVFLGLGGFVLGILNSYRRFGGPAMAPLSYNIAIIVAALVAVPLAGRNAIFVLAGGVVAGGLAHLAVQIPSLRATGWRYRLNFDWRHPGVREVAALMLPISLGMAATQVNLVVDRVLATILPAGRVAALGYANYVVQVPLGTFAAALAMVIFPFLAHDAALDRLDDLKRRAILALRLNLFVQVPAAAGLAILSVPVIQFIYQRGAFNVASTGYTSGALVFFCLGLFPQAGVALLARVFYALRDVRTPVRAALATIVVNVGLNLVLVHPLQQEGLALGTSTAALFNLALLLRQASRRFGGFGGGVLTRTALRSLVASAAMALGAYNVYTLLSAPLEGSLHRAIALFAAVAAGAALYALVSALLRAEELGMVVGMLRRRGAPQGA